MKRKIFFKRIFAAMLGAMVLDNNNNSMAMQEEKDNQKTLLNWISAMLGQLNQDISRPEISEILENCGRQCAKQGAIHLAKNCNGDLDLFLSRLAGIIGEKNVEFDKNSVKIRYDKCYCPIVAMKSDTPGVLCNCSRGWLHEMFETVLAKPVNVESNGSILQGDDSCEFKIHI